MKKNIVFLFSLLAMASCTYQNNNRIEQKDVNEGDEYVYGLGPDSSARQLKVTYTAKPELEARTAAIKDILYGPSTPAAPVVAADSTGA